MNRGQVHIILRTLHALHRPNVVHIPIICTCSRFIQKINLQEPQRNRKLCQFNNDQYSSDMAWFIEFATVHVTDWSLKILLDYYIHFILLIVKTAYLFLFKWYLDWILE